MNRKQKLNLKQEKRYHTSSFNNYDNSTSNTSSSDNQCGI